MSDAQEGMNKEDAGRPMVSEKVPESETIEEEPEVQPPNPDDED